MRERVRERAEWGGPGMAWQGMGSWDDGGRWGRGNAVRLDAFDEALCTEPCVLSDFCSIWLQAPAEVADLDVLSQSDSSSLQPAAPAPTGLDGSNCPPECRQFTVAGVVVVVAPCGLGIRCLGSHLWVSSVHWWPA